MKNAIHALGCLALLLLAGAVAAPAQTVDGLPSEPVPLVEGPEASCSSNPAEAVTAQVLSPILLGHDPATCGRCLHCSSDNLCAGRLFGDPCNNNGGSCQAFDGCALYNCCRCVNAPPLAPAAPGT